MSTITFFEQSAFIVEHEGFRIAVDFGSYSSEKSIRQAENCDTVLVSHIHPDHFDETILKRINRPVYTVREVSEAMPNPDFPVSILGEGESVKIPNSPFSVLATASDHGTNIRKPVENVGFLIRTPEESLYFLGDMAVSTAPPLEPYDLVIIPVGNNGYVFGPSEASNHIRTIGWRGRTVPVHYHNTFSDPESGSLFADACKDVCTVHVVEVGSSISL